MDSGKIVSRLGMQMSAASWQNFRRDYTSAILVSFFNVVFNQFYIPIAIHHGAGNLQVGLLVAAPAIGLLFSPIWAGLIESSHPKPFMVIPTLIGRLLVIIPAIFAYPWVFVFVMLMFQLLNGVQAPAYASLITRIYPPRLRGRLMGNVRVIMGGLMIPLAYIAGRWIDASGSGGSLVAAAVTGALSVLLFSRVRDTEPAPRKPAAVRRSSFSQQWRLLKNNKRLALFLAATTYSGFGNLLANPLYQIIQVDKLELSNIEIGYARISYYIFLMLAYLVMGWVIDRFSPSHAIFFGMAAYGVVPLLYAVFGNYSAVLAGSGVQGIGDAIWDIGCMAYVFRIAPGREAVVFGLHLMLFGIRGTIAPLLSTWSSHFVSFQFILYVAAACSWAGFLLFAYENRKRRLRRQQIKRIHMKKGAESQ